MDEAKLRPRGPLHDDVHLAGLAACVAQQHPGRGLAEIMATFMTAEREAVPHHQRSGGAGPHGLQHKALREIAADRDRVRVGRPEQEVPGLVVEQPREHGGTVEPG